MLPAHLCIDGYRHRSIPLGQFWKIQSAILVGTYLVSGIGFLVFHLNALLLIGILICQAFIVQGDLGVKERESPLEDWWEARGLSRTEHMEEQEM